MKDLVEKLEGIKNKITSSPSEAAEELQEVIDALTAPVTMAAAPPMDPPPMIPIKK